MFRCLLVCLAVGHALGELARLRIGGGQIVTSSTLKWVSNNAYTMKHAIPVVADDLSVMWCRFNLHGAYVGASLKKGVCSGPFLQSVVHMTDGFEVLTSISNSARVKRIEWDKYNAAPNNAVSSFESKKNFLAYRVDEKGNLQTGFLIPRERRMHLEDGSNVRLFDNGFILTEDTPLKYDLRGVSLNKKHKIVTINKDVLRQTTLENRGHSEQTIVEEMEVDGKHLMYWGQVPGTVVGLPVVVKSKKPYTEVNNITWGIQNRFERAHSIILEYNLPPGTATSVSVIGNIRKIEGPYKGMLTAHYDDGAKQSRYIEGLHMDDRLILLSAVYSTPYYIHNNTKLNMQELTSILYKSTTTTTTTTTQSPDDPKVSMVGPSKPKSDSLSTPDEDIEEFKISVGQSAGQSIMFRASYPVLLFGMASIILNNL